MTTRAQLKRILDKWSAQIEAPRFYCIVYPAEMPSERAQAIAKEHGLPSGTVHLHPAYSVSDVTWKALL